MIVNRIWQHHFGKGIVPTLDNFGKMGEQPTNQALLDWLAVEFMNKGWSIKQMQRLIMTSEAYQMASEYDDAASAKNDPEDTYLWRYRIQRLEGEIIRDNIMSAAGSIDLTMGGPAVFPHVDESFIKTLFRGIYRNQDDGPRRVAAKHLCLPQAHAAVSYAAGLRLARYEPVFRRQVRIDGADAGAAADERRFRPPPGATVRGPGQKRGGR